MYIRPGVSGNPLSGVAPVSDVYEDIDLDDDEVYQENLGRVDTKTDVSSMKDCGLGWYVEGHQ